jgi:catechol 2,3-dioxygenase-like lactoylglutathione lyase family enzyme
MRPAECGLGQCQGEHSESVSASRKLIFGYHDAIDRGQATSALEVVDELAEFDMRGEKFIGRAAIGEFLARREAKKNRHTVHTLVHESVIDATATWATLAHRLLANARAETGNYVVERALNVTHQVSHTTAGWRITQRTSQPLHPTAVTGATASASPTEGTTKMTEEPVRSVSPAAVPLQMAELVLKTARFEEMFAWYSHLLGRGPFYERTPDPDAPPRPAGMPERAVDVRLAFFEIHDNGHPHSQILGLFGIGSLADVAPAGPGLHHFQFGVGSLGELINQYERMSAIGATPHRTANHGQATSFYFRDPDGNIIEFSCSNFPTAAQEREFMASPGFAANPSGLELDAAAFAARFHAGEPVEQLLSIDVPGGAPA